MPKKKTTTTKSSIPTDAKKSVNKVVAKRAQAADQHCINVDGHRFATNHRNDDNTYEVYCKECGLLIKDSPVAH